MTLCMGTVSFTIISGAAMKMTIMNLDCAGPRVLAKLMGSLAGAFVLLAPLSLAAQQDPLKPSDDTNIPVLDAPEIEEPTFTLPLTGRPAGSYPNLEIISAHEIENDWTFDSDDSDNELSDLYATFEPFIALHITPELSIESGLVFEPVKDPDPGDSRAFEDQGLYAETLGVVYANDLFSVYGGKFNPTFGAAWDVAPGIYGADFAEDYELTERIGFGGSLTGGNDDYGFHTLSGNLFFLDTTFLSKSAFTNRGRTRKSDGGVSNTESLESFSVTLDGADMPFLPGLGYTLGVERQEGGKGDPKDELGFVAGLYGAFDVTSETTLEPILEYVYLDNAEGQRQDRQYITVGSAIFRGPWNLSASYTGRFTDPDGESNIDDTLYQVSLGYEFDFGLAVDIGYGFTEEEDIDSHTVGLVFAYEFDLLVY
jgi:hypothetical protein